MGTYDTQQVCIKGHQVTDRHNGWPQHRRKFCAECGSTTIHQCPACSAEIKGDYSVSGVLVVGSSTAPVPSHCDECGRPFPWTGNGGVSASDVASIWKLIHPRVANVAKPRFETGQFADAAEAACKAVITRVKRIWVAAGRTEQDGKSLMLSAFSVQNPVIRLGDLTTETGRNIQEGYMHLFAGMTQGVRNPKAHDEVVIKSDRCLHFLMLTSLLMSKLDEVNAA